MNYSIKFKKLKLKFNRNTKLQKVKTRRLNKSSMIIRPINFFSKKDLIY
jgi:hypothetical protein